MGRTARVDGDISGHGRRREADQPGKTKIAINFDSKDHPTADANYDASAWKHIDSNTFEVTRKKDGKVVQRGTNTVSKDWKTMTTTAKGTSGSGQPLDNVSVFDKQ